MKLALCALLLALTITPAHAQVAGQAPAPSSGDRLAALAAARDMLVSMGFERQMEQAGMAMANTTFEHNVAREEEKLGVTMPADLKRRVRTVMNEQLGVMLNDMKRTALDDAAQIYADHFTADELRRLAVLNADPVMRKAQSLLPQMMPQLAQIGLKSAAKHEPVMQAKIKEVVDEWTASQKSKSSAS